ncbi:hypothetical protein BXZ70DRAFT_614468 [Cristinia sonorae]|uniref:DUF6535 domain-containing protein n=1 Tax=Cristinia sonorae TaxID=1940300 RepID=A0A8K0UX05_9AGAR|nr:hypothetical protein BXZ70DRAFT_614468 [Cristinia sonorae]
MDSIIIFAGLFSAIVTAFIIEGYKTLRVDPSDAMVFYLQQMSQQMAGLSNASTAPPPLTLPVFEPSRSDIAVNALWMLSLIFSLACALGSTLIQAWTNRYVRHVSKSPDVIQRARDRARYFDGIKKSQMENLADGLPALLHIALFLFLGGLVVWLFPINHDVAYAAMAVSAAFSVIYLLLAALHIFVPHWPYHTPLSYAIVGVFFIAASPIAVIYPLSLTAGGLLAGAVAIPLAVIAAITYLVLRYGFSIHIDARGIYKIIKRVMTSPLPRIRREGLYAHETMSRIQPGPKDIKQDRHILQWLLRHSNSVDELEDVLEGIEPFIDRAPKPAEAAAYILQLGGEEIGSFMTEFGAFVGILLHACSLPSDTPLEARQSRSLACTRAMIAIFTHTSPKDRVADTLLPLTGIFDWMPRQSIISTTKIPIRWEQWASRSMLYGLNYLRGDPEPSVRFYSHCLTALLFHRSLIDVAYRMEIGEVGLHVPPHWDLRAFLPASTGIHRDELFELIVAVSLAQGVASPKPRNVSVSYDLEPAPWQWSWKSRPIEVVYFEKEENGAEFRPAIVPMRAAKLRNEATLFALSFLLEHVYGTALEPSLAHLDLLHRTIAAITFDGSAGETSTGMQESFLRLLMKIYKPQDVVFDPEPMVEPIHLSSHNDTRDPDEGKPPVGVQTAREHLREKKIVDLIVPLLDSLDSADCATQITAVRQLLRPPRHPTSPVPSEASVSSIVVSGVLQTEPDVEDVGIKEVVEDFRDG